MAPGWSNLAELHEVYHLSSCAAVRKPLQRQRDATPAAAALEGQVRALRDTAELLRTQLDDIRKDRGHDYGGGR